ncbi:MAG: hypothetical protein ABW110_02060, partial [Steroidobacteraceae bacterium]
MHRALPALARAAASCWPLLLTASIAPLILAWTGQGKDALLIATSGLGFKTFFLIWLGGLMVLAYARFILEAGSRGKLQSRASRYAKHTMPQILGITAIFALPIFLRSEPAQDGVLGLMFLLQLIAPTLLIVGIQTSHLNRGASHPEVLPIFLVLALYVVAFVITDPNSVLHRFAVLVVGIVVVNWFFPSTYLRSKDSEGSRLSTVGWIALLYAGVVLWLAVAIALAPVTQATRWGPADVVLMALLAWLCIGFVLEWLLFWLLGRGIIPWKRKVIRCPWLIGPVRAVVFGVVAYGLLTGSFGDTEARVIKADLKTPRPGLAPYIDQWLADRSAHATDGQPYPVFIVTSEGGGIRAGYWTATVLAALQDKHPEFANHVLALSGVSGGSVGNSIFSALTQRPAGAPIPQCQRSGGLEACAKALGGSDLLSAPVASMLLSEPFNRLTRRIESADRAADLERSLERAWQTTIGDDAFSVPFSTVATSGPLLLPNTTSAFDGERVVISTLDLGPDARVLDGRAFSLSTATFLSARFPGVSPAGLYRDTQDRWWRLVDGGFADNSGAATGAEILAALAERLERNGLRARFRPIVIAITNGMPATDAIPERGGFRTLTLGAILDPLLTLNSVRGTLSKQLQAQLRKQVTAEGGLYLDGFSLRHGGTELPLGWMLAPQTTERIDDSRRALMTDPAGHFVRVISLLPGVQRPNESR